MFSALFGLLLLQFFPDVLDVGDMTTVCKDCGALVWIGERSVKADFSVSPDVSMCCMKGNVSLSFMETPPQLLLDLFAGVDPRGGNFLSNLRLYNNMFSFTSLGGQVRTNADGGRGPPQFTMAGQNYHRIGTLLPSDGERPKFAQLYIYDTENEVANCYTLILDLKILV
jgi:hypothetical protein